MRPGYKGFKGAELLGDHQGRVIGQHDAAAADAHGVGGSGHMADEHGGCGAGESFDGVVFGEPETAIAPLLNVLREVHGSGNRGARGLSRVHRNEIKH